jgi:hypothetical protein
MVKFIFDYGPCVVARVDPECFKKVWIQKKSILIMLWILRTSLTRTHADPDLKH